MGRGPSPARVHWMWVQVAEQIRADVTAAMKAGDRDRVTALRLVLSELQKDAKEGAGDELAVLRRERKRRRESEQAYRDAGREDLATGEAYEAETIEAYLPAALPDEEIDALVARGDRGDGGELAPGHGPGDQAGDGCRRRARRRQDGLDQGEGSAQLDGKTAIGALERGGGGAGRRPGLDPADAGAAPRLRGLPARERGHARRRGRRGAGGRDGHPRAVLAGRARARHRARDDRVGRARAGPERVAVDRARGRRVAPSQPARRAQVGQPEALRGRHPAAPRSPSASARRARARPSWRSRWPSPRSRAARSTGSSSPARPWRPASGSASCPAT